jgi:hypothetical protein
VKAFENHRREDGHPLFRPADVTRNSARKTLFHLIAKTALFRMQSPEGVKLPADPFKSFGSAIALRPLPAI